MPTSLSPVSIANVALSKCGAQAINSFTDQTNPSSVAVNIHWQLCYLEVSRATRWNCLLDTAILVEEPQTPLPGVVIPASVGDWAPNTAYAANVYLTYGGYYYITAYAYTSSAISITIDLTDGALIQTNLPTSGQTFPSNGSQYPSGWSFKYALPADFQLLASLNQNTCSWGWDGWGAETAEYQLMGAHLFCNQSQAVIQYVKNVADTTKFDALFTNALTLKLASAISTQLRQDGGRLEAELLQGYMMALKEARTKNAGERQPRRFNPIGSSNFNRARFGGVNG